MLAWCLYYLAEHPEIQQRVADEMDAVMGDEVDVPVEAYGKLRWKINQNLFLRNSRPTDQDYRLRL